MNNSEEQEELMGAGDGWRRERTASGELSGDDR